MVLTPPLVIFLGLLESPSHNANEIAMDPTSAKPPSDCPRSATDVEPHVRPGFSMLTRAGIKLFSRPTPPQYAVRHYVFHLRIPVHVIGVVQLIAESILGTLPCRPHRVSHEQLEADKRPLSSILYHMDIYKLSIRNYVQLISPDTEHPEPLPAVHPRQYHHRSDGTMYP
jgi:hypothetical protein